MKKNLEEMLLAAVNSLKGQGVLDPAIDPPIQIDRSRDPQHGDYASNLAMTLSKAARKKPRDLAGLIMESLPESPLVAKIEIAGPGFINFFIDARAQFSVIPQIHRENSQFGRSSAGAGKKVQIEFVSANPTGPLHVGHGRGAAYGSAVASLLEAAGFAAHREYYVNDAGRQMDILAASIWLRYLEKCGEVLPFPSNGYRGNYIREIAKKIHRQSGDRYQKSALEIIAGLPADEPDAGDKEEYIDAMIERCRALLGTEGFEVFLKHGLDDILEDIRLDLEEFGVSYDEWFSERGLIDAGAVEKGLARLQAAGFLYEKDGATWFACSRLGDEKDRVVIRENGQTTYLASDIAYHLNKIERGFDTLIDVWGADHHGYVPRIRAAIEALGAEPSRLEVLLVQFAVLYRGREKVSMSTRSGEFVTLRELRNEVGRDAARFFYLMRRCEQHMDFDLDLARSQSNDNPVYYVQYAHARICSVFRKLDEKNWKYDPNQGMAHLGLLREDHEQDLVSSLSRYPEVIESAALKYEPHLVIQYLRDLANEFHKYNHAHRFLVDQAELRNARLNLIAAVRQVIANGLGLLGISAPEAM
ncbi:MAG: arginine--tRNA ligase [Methylococcaceae bacterium]|nr:arginine--tRNA ligase [Methylococcaceae bacterium]